MENEPVKIKMKLHAARPSVQGAAPTLPAAAAAIEAVEARWKAEDKKIRAERFKKRVKGCLSWVFILLVAVGAVWYFAGDKFLPQEYTFNQVWPKAEQVWDKIKALWSSKPPTPAPAPEPKEDPTDIATATERTAVKEFVAQLETLCTSDLPTVPRSVSIGSRSWDVGQAMLNDIVSADNWYVKAKQRLDEMNAQNESLGNRRKEESGAKGRQYASQYSKHDIERQRNAVATKGRDCQNVRTKAVQRAIKAVKTVSAKWTGPKGRKDATQLLEKVKKIKVKEFKDQ